MEYKKIKFSLVLIAISAFNAVSIESAEAAPEFSGYDEIVRELSSNESRSTVNSAEPSEIIHFHAGVGLITSRTSLDLPKPLADAKSFRGIEIMLGIDLMSPEWVAQGKVRNFDPEKLGAASIELKEFDLLVIHILKLQEKLKVNLGGGMAARYLDINGPTPVEVPRTNTTPSTVIQAGLDLSVTSAISIGAQFSYRSPLVRETADNGATDGTILFSGRF